MIWECASTYSIRSASKLGSQRNVSVLCANDKLIEKEILASEIRELYNLKLMIPQNLEIKGQASY